MQDQGTLAEGRQQQTSALRSFAFDRLSAIAAVLDSTGTIVDTNEAWRLFALLNDGSASTTGPGISYLDVCDQAAAAGVDGASVIARALREILAGTRDHFDLEYPCPSPAEDRWFLFQASSAPVDNGGGAVLFHVDLTSRKLREERFAAQAEMDELTGLPNRRAAVRLINEELADAQLTGAQVWVHFFDLDGFKTVNDCYGHHVGDDLLVKVAMRARKAVREQDRLCRLGGDEFVLVCPDLGHKAAGALSSRLRQVMSQPFQFGSMEVKVGASVGFAASHADSTVDDLLGAADAQMYLDKRRRKAVTPGRLTSAARLPHGLRSRPRQPGD